MPQQTTPGIVVLEYKGHPITYDNEGWFNATQAAAKFDKGQPYDWIRLPSTQDYLDALCRQLRTEKISVLKVIRGGRSRPDGTWFHPKLAVPFARWLDVEFAVWCDLQIDAIIRSKDNWMLQRHAAAASYKVMSLALKETRQQAGKGCDPYHYQNEARVVNFALVGKFAGLDRDQMPVDQLDLLAHLEVRNTLMIAQGLKYEQRKSELLEQAKQWRVANQPKLQQEA
jgi:hypothetical protein